MILSDKLRKELINLEENIQSLITNKNINQFQLEAFLRNLEKQRYNILTQIKVYNNTVQYNTEKIRTISNEYKATLEENILKIYIPEVLPSYKNIKTHTHKRILLNVSEVTKPFANIFDNEVFIYIKVFDKILGWDIDNKYIKPISDALTVSKVITDDKMSKMFYCAKGEYSETPHTEIYVFDSKDINNFLEKYST